MYELWFQNLSAGAIEPSLNFSFRKPIDLDEQIIVGLRRREGVNLESLAINWGWNHQKRKEYISLLESQLKDLINQGVLKQIGKRLQLSEPLGMEISNQVFVEILLWWEQLPDDAVVAPSPLRLLRKVDDLQSTLQ